MPEDVTEACLLLLAMAASNSTGMRAGMSEVLVKTKQITRGRGIDTFVNFTLEDKIPKSCKEAVTEKMSKLEWDDADVKEAFRLVRKFSFVGEYTNTDMVEDGKVEKKKNCEIYFTVARCCPMTRVD
jgi:hypothetical protein